MSYTPTYRAPKRNAHRSHPRDPRAAAGGPRGQEPCREESSGGWGRAGERGAGRAGVAILNEQELSLSRAHSASGDLLIPFLPLARGSARRILAACRARPWDTRRGRGIIPRGFGHACRISPRVRSTVVFEKTR